MKKVVLSFVALTLIIACKNNNNNKTAMESEENQQDISAEQEEEWQYLFDGSSAEGWRGYNSEGGLPEGWIVEGETLKSLGQGGDIGGDIVYGAEEFGEFELALEWKISERGNSGIFYHVVEDEKYSAPYFTGPEYQILDQIGYPLQPVQSIGSDYGMYSPEYNEEDLKGVGEWNTSRIKFTKDKVTYWLNGKKTVEFDPSSQDWEKRKSEGKWKEFPDYGKADKGLIGLQDHGSPIWFRNIKIRGLK
jgi:hypothetical protein